MRLKRNRTKLRNGIIFFSIIIIIIILFMMFIKKQSHKKIEISRWNTTYYYSNNNDKNDIEKQENIEVIDDNRTWTNKTLYEININAENLDENSSYVIQYGTTETNEVPLESNTKIKIELKTENKSQITIKILKNRECIYEANREISYIKPYQKQFLDELENLGINNKVTTPYSDNGEVTIELLKSLGINNVRVGLWWSNIEKQTNQYDYSKYDEWIQKYEKNGINILAILGFGNENLLGSDKKISNDNELNSYINYVKDATNKYGIDKLKYEIWNEPNSKVQTEEDYNWYASMVNKANNSDFLVGSTMTPDNSTQSHVTSQEFLNKIIDKTNKNNNSYSIHIYDWYLKSLNSRYKNIVKEHKNLLNENGGFNKLNLTETGSNTYNITVEEQAYQLVQQQVLSKKYNIESNFLYCFKDTGTDKTNKEHNFGILNYDYTPKLSYYSLKNYYENTNGAEYIGMVNLSKGLESHVYNKDGKPKIITWSNNINRSINIKYENFIAKDLYGNDIENTDGTLTITTSPVYLENISTNYFYQAISDTLLEKYKEFEEKFNDEISKVNGLNSKIQDEKTYITNLSNISELSEIEAIQVMKNHYKLGNNILQTYKEGKLDIEFVKLSSMLDILNEIGNSYEDLVTVSAKTRSSNLEETNSLIQEAETIIANNEDLEIVYPNKILDFSKEYYEKALYINNLEEENDIKTGLIVSKNLHANLLASWSKEFSEIYIDKYIKENPVTVTYSESNLTNKDVIAKLETNANIEVINNSNNKEHIFSENGNFIFEYNIKGQAFTIEAKVNNIDKTPPSITGIQEGKTYKYKVTPKVTDNNLQEVKLLSDGQVVDGYIVNSEIDQEGFYQLIANDKAGNNTIVNFQIIEPSDEDYIIENNIIKNITNNTKKYEFDEKFASSQEYNIIRNDEEISSNDKIATGDILKTKSGEEYILIVTGDINKDGDVNIKDIVKLRKYLLLKNNMDEIEKIAADTNLDGREIGIKDLVKMRIIVLTKEIVQ